MSSIKKFIVVKKLNSTVNHNGDIVSDEYSLSEIKTTLGENVTIISDELKFHNDKIYLVLTCKNKVTREKDPAIADALKAHLKL